MNLSDVQTAIHLAPLATRQVSVLGGPLGVVGRIIGMSGEDVERGIPTWAWVVLGVGAGVAAGYFARPTIEAFTGNGRQIVRHYSERPRRRHFGRPLDH